MQSKHIKAALESATQHKHTTQTQTQTQTTRHIKYASDMPLAAQSRHSTTPQHTIAPSSLLIPLTQIHNHSDKNKQRCRSSQIERPYTQKHTSQNHKAPNKARIQTQCKPPPRQLIPQSARSLPRACHGNGGRASSDPHK